MRGVVYKIKCSCGFSYIGQTKRLLEIRKKEHEAYVRNTQYGKSGLADHALKNKNKPRWKEIKVVARDKDQICKEIKEKLNIERTPGALNSQEGTSFSEIWRAFL